MKKITFPHMGNLSIAVDCFFKELGFETVVPPANSQKTLNLGIKHSPEFACLPLKITIGNFIEALDNGANFIVMGGGVGPCRFGYYCEVQREVLEDLGYEFDFFVIEPKLSHLFYNIHQKFNYISLKKIYSAGKIAWKKTLALDEINSLVLKNRGRVSYPDKVDKEYNEFKAKIAKASTIEKIEKLSKDYSEKINNILHNYKLEENIKIGIVGEIYLTLEPFINRNIAKKLGKLGVSLSRKIYLSEWVYEFLNLNDEEEKARKNAYKYLKSKVGGHGMETIGNGVYYAKKNYDGLIQLAPFTCMPEIVAESILPELSEKENIPVLTIFFDEHTADAGLETRLEAFVDLLIRKKKGSKNLYAQR
ncbi:MAG: acyl-CoA dehydratase activase-related protein [Bacillota bacterium]